MGMETLAVVTNASTTVPKVISATDVWFTQAIIEGKRAQGTANTGIVYIGASSVDGENPHEVLPGTPFFFSAPAGGCLNLGALYMDVATANDGLMITVIKPLNRSA